MDIINIFGIAFIIGLAFNAAPGAIFAQTLALGIKHGFRPALYVQIGSLVGDGVWAALGLIGVTWLMSFKPVVTPLLVIGGGYMIFLAIQTVKDAFNIEEVKAKTAKGTPLMSGVALSLGNPLNISYWVAVGATVHAMTRNVEGPVLTVFFFGFMASSLIWCFTMAGFSVAIARHTPPIVWKTLLLISAIILAWLGCGSIYTAFFNIQA